ncbi:hypothetical protein Tco_0183187 [Tanacetum coccineum]
MKVKESLNVTFDESPPTKLLPLVDDDVGEEEAIKNNTKVVNNNNIDDESIEVEVVVNIKESKYHPLEQQTALAISTSEAEYVSAGKVCQHALWMKQALIDYDIRLDDVPIMCENKGAHKLK